MSVSRKIYGLVQEMIIAKTELKDHFLSYSYAPIIITQVLWMHADKKNTFTLVADNFIIKYRKNKYAYHHMHYNRSMKLFRAV